MEITQTSQILRCFQSSEDFKYIKKTKLNNHVNILNNLTFDKDVKMNIFFSVPLQNSRCATRTNKY